MAYPVVGNTSTGSTARDTSHSITLPANISADDLLLVFFATDGDTTISNWGGFTGIFNVSHQADCSLSVGWKIAVGSDTLTITTADSEEGSYVCFRITGHSISQAPEASTGVSAETGTAPDPDLLTPTGGSKEYLWFAAEGNDHLDTTSAWPLPDNNLEACGGASGSCNIGVCSDDLTQASLNPSTFTIDASEQWVACTVAVHPVDTGAQVSLNTAASTVSAESITLDTPVSVGINPAASTTTAKTLTLDTPVTISINPAAIVSSTEVLTVMPEIIISINTAGITSSAKAITLDVPVSISINTAVINGAAKTIVLDTAVIIGINSATLTIAAKSITLNTPVTITLNSATITTSAKTLTLVYDQQISINTAAITSGAESLTVSLATKVDLSTVSITSAALTITEVLAGVTFDNSNRHTDILLTNKNLTACLKSLPFIPWIGAYAAGIATVNFGGSSFAHTIPSGYSAYGSGVTLDSSRKHADITLSGGDLILTGNANVVWRSVGATGPAKRTGKWYFEITADSCANSPYLMIGIGPISMATNTHPGQTSADYGYFSDNGSTYNNGSETYGNSYTTNHVIMVAVDLDDGMIYWGIDGTWQASGNPATDTNPAYINLSGAIDFRSVCVTEEKTSGKWYLEATIDFLGHVSGINIGFDIDTMTVNEYSGYTATGWGEQSHAFLYNNATPSGYGLSFSVSDVVILAIDLDNNKAWWGLNGTWFNSGDPAAGTNAGTTSFNGNFALWLGIHTSSRVTINLGRSAFSHTAPSGFTPYDAGPVTIALSVAASTSAALTLTLDTPISIIMGVASVAASTKPVDAKTPIIIILSAATIISATKPVSAVLEGPILLGVLGLVSSTKPVNAKAPETIILSAASITSLAKQLSVTTITTVALFVASSTVSAKTITLDTPVSITLNDAALVSAAPSITLDTPVTISLSTATATASTQSVDAKTPEIIVLSTATATTAAPTLSVEAGLVVSLNAASVTTTAESIALNTPVTILFVVAALTAGAEQLNVATVTTITITEISATALTKQLIVLPGETSISVDALAGVTSLPTLTLVPGEVTPAMSTIAAVSAAESLSLSLQVSVLLDSLNLISSTKVLAVIVPLTVNLNVLTAVLTAHNITIALEVTAIGKLDIEFTLTIPRIEFTLKIPDGDMEVFTPRMEAAA